MVTKLSPAQATHFQRYSSMNACTVQATLKCGCKPYQDVFTYVRWQAQGYQVMRGEHSISIPVIVEREHELQDGSTETQKIKWVSHVFCRHQVKAIGTATPAPITPALVPVKVNPIIESVANKAPVQPDVMAGWRVI